MAAEKLYRFKFVYRLTDCIYIASNQIFQAGGEIKHYGSLDVLSLVLCACCCCLLDSSIDRFTPDCQKKLTVVSCNQPLKVEIPHGNTSGRNVVGHYAFLLAHTQNVKECRPSIAV